MANYAVLNGDIIVNIIVADTQNIAEEVTGAECVKVVPEDHIKQGDYYDRKWNVCVPVGMVYEPISKKIMTPDEKAAL